VTQTDGVLTLVMNRPDKKNALTDGMYGALADAISAARTDRAARVIVIRGAGDVFTAGNDLAEFASAGPRDDCSTSVASSAPSPKSRSP
jgi:enoyl-CoA hydratase/carnithine racemase